MKNVKLRNIKLKISVPTHIRNGFAIVKFDGLTKNMMLGREFVPAKIFSPTSSVGLRYNYYDDTITICDCVDYPVMRHQFFNNKILQLVPTNDKISSGYELPSALKQIHEK